MKRLWILPFTLIVLTAFSIYGTAHLRPMPSWMIGASVLVGVALGVPIGYFRGRASNIRLSDKAGAVVVEPSFVAMLMWLAAFAIRYALRLLLPNAGPIAMALSDAFIVFAAAGILSMRYLLFAKFKQLRVQSAHMVET